MDKEELKFAQKASKRAAKNAKDEVERLERASMRVSSRKKISGKNVLKATTIALASTATVITPVVVYYKKNEKYEVSILSEAEEFETYTLKIKRGTIITELKEQLKTLSGHNLVGIYKDEQCTIPFSGDEKITKKTNVYLKYQKKRYQISLPSEEEQQANGYKIFSETSQDLGSYEWGNFSFVVQVENSHKHSQVQVLINDQELDWEDCVEHEDYIQYGYNTFVDENINIQVENIQRNEYSVSFIGGAQNLLNVKTGEVGNQTLQTQSYFEMFHDDRLEISYNAGDRNNVVSKFLINGVAVDDDSFKDNSGVKIDIKEFSQGYGFIVIEDITENIAISYIEEADSGLLFNVHESGFAQISGLLDGQEYENVVVPNFVLNKPVKGVLANFRWLPKTRSVELLESFNSIPNFEGNVSQLIINSPAVYEKLSYNPVRNVSILQVNKEIIDQQKISNYDVEMAGYFTQFDGGDYYIFVNTHNLEDNSNFVSIVQDGNGLYLSTEANAHHTLLRIVDGTKTSFEIHENCKQVNVSAFAGTQIESIHIKSGITQICSNAFNDCELLKEVYISSKAMYQKLTSLDALGGLIENANTLVIANSIEQNNNFINDNSLFFKLIGEAYNYYCANNERDEMLIIPQGVIEIPAYTFQDNANLKQIILPSTLGIIGNQAFKNSAITEISIPASVQTIAEAAFETCMYLSTVEIETNSQLKTIEGYAFADSSIGAIEIPAGVTSIKEKAFENCSSLSNVIFNGQQLTEIGDSAFSNCSSLTRITLPSSLKTIGNNAFYQTALTSISIPANVTLIGYCAFSGCSDLANVTFAEGINLEEIQPATFTGCSSLESIIIPASVRIINTDAFSGCSGLTSVIFAEDCLLEEIGPTAFCFTKLESIIIPESVNLIDGYAFDGCTNLETVTILSATIYEQLTLGISCGGLIEYAQSIKATNDYSPTTDVLETNFYKMEGDYYYYLRKTEATEIIIPEGVKVIPASTFAGNKYIKVVNIPETVKEIGDSAFSGCSNLTTINIAENSQLETIGDSAFASSGLISISIPSTVNVIGNAAFYDCDELGTVTFAEGIKIQSIGSGTFNDCYKLQEIVIPASVKELRDSCFSKAGTQVAQFKVSFEENSELETIESGAFSGCSTLKEISIPASVKVIYDCAFSGCSVLKTVTIQGRMLTLIDENAFYQCEALESINLPTSLETIRKSAFYQTALTSISIPAGVNEIGYQAFELCSSLTSVTFAEGIQLEEIKPATFSGCTQLTTISIPASVRIISTDAFSGCSGLTSVIFDENSSLETIDATAFQNTKLESIIIPESVNFIGFYAFDNCLDLAEVTILSSTIYQELTQGNDAGKLIENAQRIMATNAYSASEDALTTDFYKIEGDYYYYLRKTNATEIIIPEGVEVIPASTFAGNTFIQKVSLPNSLIEISESAFSDCKNLNNVTFATNCQLEEIGINAFKGTGITSISIPANVKVIYDGAFEGSSLRSITFKGNKLNSIEEYAFSKCVNLTSISLPTSLTELRTGVFADSGLTSIFIPGNVQYIPMYAFAGCDSLSRVEFASNSVCSSISENSFKDCSALKEIKIPATVESISPEVFVGCSGLETVIFAEGSILDRMGYSVFSGTKIKTIVLPSTVTGLDNTFDGAEYLKSVFIRASANLDSETQNYLAEDFLEFGGELNKESYYVYTPKDENENVVIPDGVTIIPAETFKNNPYIRSVTLPNSLKIIGDEAFAGTNITTITIPVGVTHINEGAFAESSLNKITFNSSLNLQVIGARAFYATNITNISIPAKVTEIASSTFKDCQSLTDVSFVNGGVSCTRIGEQAFEGCSLKSITIPANVLSIEAGAFAASSLQYITFAQGSLLKTIGNEAFYSSNLVNISLPSTLNSIGDLAFASTPIQGVSINGLNLKSIGAQAFNECTELTTINLPNTLTTIGEHAFNGCNKLTTINLPNSLTELRTGVFADSGLRSIEIPANIEDIYEGVFGSCDKLERVTFAEGSKCSFIDYYAFSGCPSLKTIIIPAGVTSIAPSAFWESGLETVIFAEGSKLESMGYSVFGGTKITTITLPSTIKVMQDTFDGANLLQTIYIPKTATLDSDVDEDLKEDFYKLENETYYVYWAKGDSSQVVIPEGITGITANAFAGLTSLKSVSLPKTLKVIGDGAFNGCSNLSGVELYNCSELTTIGAEAFKGTQFISTIHIPENVTSIGRDAFAEVVGYDWVNVSSPTIAAIIKTDQDIAGWNNYIWIKIDCDTYLESGGNSFLDNGTNGYAKLQVGEYYYKFMPKEDALYMLEDVTYIGDYSFHGLDSLTSITLPSTLTSLGYAVFAGCDNLESVDLSQTQLTELYEHDFNGCSSLREVLFPESLKTIGSYAFAGTDFSSDLTLPDTVTQIGEYAFADSNISRISFEGPVTYIGYSAFSGCTNLKGVSWNAFYDYDLKANSIVIETNAFNGCTGLTSMPFSNIYSYQQGYLNNVITVKDYAFRNCSSIEVFWATDSLGDVEPNAFRGLNIKTLEFDEAPFLFQKLTSPTSLGGIMLDNNGNLAIKEIVTRSDYSSYSSFINNAINTLNYYNSQQYMFTKNNIDGLYVFNALYGLNDVRSLTISGGYYGGTYYKNQSFMDLYGNIISEVIIEETITDIEADTFTSCYGLTSVVVKSPNLFTLLTSEDSCGGLIKYANIIEVPKSIVDARNNTYLENTNNFVILYDNENQSLATTCYFVSKSILPTGYTYTQLTEAGNCLYLGKKSSPYLVLLRMIDKASSLYYIDSQCVSIAPRAFYGAIAMDQAEIYIPSNMKSLGVYAFNGIIDLRLYIDSLEVYKNLNKLLISEQMADIEIAISTNILSNSQASTARSYLETLYDYNGTYGSNSGQFMFNGTTYCLFTNDSSYGIGGAI